MDVVTLVVLGTVLVSWQLMERPDKSKWMLVPSRCYTHKEWHRVITHAFVHADWLHLAFNMFVLYEFGRVVNRELAVLGWMGFPALYLAGIVAGAIPAL
ncbi:MAG: rhomboid family intramembrane serine protease, partial [Bacteroidota bacterium]|nr:rhomboid family intramembrane serine protease [Bacteroidota bacterium]